MLLREIDRNDIGRIAEIERECFSSPWSETQLLTAYAHDRFCGFVAEADGETVGYVCGTVLWEEAELYRIAVAAARRGNGFGGALLDAFSAECKRRGGESLFLEVRDSNTTARALYEIRGFTVTRVRKRYYANGEDALEMKRTL